MAPKDSLIWFRRSMSLLGPNSTFQLMTMRSQKSQIFMEDNTPSMETFAMWEGSGNITTFKSWLWANEQ